MIAAGNSENPDFKTEIIDLGDTNIKCQDLPAFPMELTETAGGLVQNIPVICGGSSLAGTVIQINQKCSLMIAF